MTGSINLSARLDSQATRDLAAAIARHRGDPLTLCAEQVTFLGALTLQLIIAAHRQWREDGNEFRIVNPSDAFVEGLEILGARPAEVGLGADLEVLQ